MGDFLSNLTTRTFQPTAQVQPRLPTRFEPAPNLLFEPSPALLPTGLSEVTASGSDQAQTTQPRSTAKQPVAPEESTAPPAAPHVPTPPFDHSEQRAPLLAPIPAVASASANDRPLPVGPGPAMPAQPVLAPSFEQTEPAPRTTTDTSRSRLTPPPAALPDPLPVPAQPERQPQRASRPRTIPLAAPTAALALLQQRLTQPALLPVAHGPNRPATLPAIAPPTQAPLISRTQPVRGQDELDLEQAPGQPLATPATAPTAPVAKVSPPRSTGLLTSPGQRPASPVAPARSASEPAAPPPTINVTIGRIEVRATPLTVAAKPAPAKSSTLALDEYLRRRGQGGVR